MEVDTHPPLSHTLKLHPSHNSASATAPAKERHQIREDPSGVSVTNLAQIQVTCYEDVASCLRMGTSMRSTATTLMNDKSSRYGNFPRHLEFSSLFWIRSHAVFSLNLETIRTTSADGTVSAPYYGINELLTCDLLYREGASWRKRHFQKSISLILPAASA